MAFTFFYWLITSLSISVISTLHHTFASCFETLRPLHLRPQGSSPFHNLHHCFVYHNSLGDTQLPHWGSHCRVCRRNTPSQVLLAPWPQDHLKPLGEGPGNGPPPPLAKAQPLFGLRDTAGPPRSLYQDRDRLDHATDRRTSLAVAAPGPCTPGPGRLPLGRHRGGHKGHRHIGQGSPVGQLDAHCFVDGWSAWVTCQAQVAAGCLDWQGLGGVGALAVAAPGRHCLPRLLETGVGACCPVQHLSPCPDWHASLPPVPFHSLFGACQAMRGHCLTQHWALRLYVERLVRGCV